MEEKTKNSVEEKKKEKIAKASASKIKKVNNEKNVENKVEKPSDSKTDKKKEIKKSKKNVKKVKKTEAVVNVKNIPISTKHSVAICRFIKNKNINDAIKYLEQVVLKKKAVPMKGEIPHRKGKMMSGRYPKKASEHFIKIIKSLEANAYENGLDEPVIVEAIANFAERPYGRFGTTQKKRTHISIKCKEKKWKKGK